MIIDMKMMLDEMIRETYKFLSLRNPIHAYERN